MTTTTIGPTSSQNATIYGWEHKLDRTQNDVAWATFFNSNRHEFWFSTDDGANWTEDVAGRVVKNEGRSAFFVDEDDYAHFVYNSYPVMYYRRGTPNATRTAWTWSAEHTVETASSGNNVFSPTCVAYRLGTGWVCNVVYTRYQGSNASRYRVHNPVTITSAGAISSANQGDQFGTGHSTNPLSLDFNHTGDGKTVANGDPSLYIGMTGPSNTIEWGTLVYSAPGGVPEWNFKSPAKVLVYSQYPYNGLFTGFYDGTRSVVAWLQSNATTTIAVREVDPPTEAITVLPSPPTLSSGNLTNLTATYDEELNIYIWATPQSTTTGPQQTIYNRAAGTWSAWTLLASTTTHGQSLTLKRGWSGNAIEGIWTDSFLGGFSVSYAQFGLNAKPDAPTISLPTDNETVNLTSGVDFYYVYSDPDGNPQVGYALKRRLVTAAYGVVYGPDEWWDGAAWVASETVVASTAQPIATAWSVGRDTYQYSLANSDFGRLGSYSTYQTLNPFEWWDGTNWVPMVEGWIVSTASEVTLSGAQNNLEEGFDYDWSVATKDTWSWYGPYASMFTFIAGGGSLARIWNGTAWLDHEIFVRVTSSAWAKHSARVWDGTAWVTY